MPIILDAQKADVLFQLDGGPADKLRVAAFSGMEAVSVPFQFNLELVSTDGSLKLADSLGKPGLLTLVGPGGKRYINGVVSRFEQVTRDKKYSTYEAKLVPFIWLLRFTSNCRIFQKMSVKDIVTKVLEDGGVASDRFKFSLKGKYSTREYCVQYRESDLTFVSRLLEEEGIYYFFEHGKDGHVLVMADNPGATVAIEGDSKLLYRPLSGQIPEKEHVHSFRFSEEIRTGKITLRDFNYLKPSVDLTATKSADRDADLEDYDYPGEYLEEAEGKTLASVRLEESRATRATGMGESICRRMTPGFRFTLEEFPRSDFNTEYAVLQVKHSGTQPQVREEAAGEEGSSYQNTFEVIKSDVPYRPERMAPRPFVRGCQTATVVGPKDETVYMDEHGRAKVMFHWDREGKSDENCTCWIRVSQGYAGRKHGIQFPPLVGDEVIVDFIEGDPDRPILTGRVYNANNLPPLKPDDRIQNVLLTPYQHRLIFDDKLQSITLNTGGSETLHMGDFSEDPDFGNNVTISTKDGHYVRLAEGDKHKGIMAQTAAEHKLEMRDDPDPEIRLVDKNGDIFLQLDTENKTINLINGTETEINIKCEGGTVNVVAAEINVDASSKVKISGGQEIALSAPNIKIDGDTAIDAKAPQVKIQAQTQLEATGGMTKVEGTGMAEVKSGGILTVQGSLVKIN